MVITMGILFPMSAIVLCRSCARAFGLVTSLGLMGIAASVLNMAVSGLSRALIGLGIDYAIQFHARPDEEA